MASKFDDSDELARIYRDFTTDHIRSIWMQGGLDKDEAAVLMNELVRRGEPVPPPPILAPPPMPPPAESGRGAPKWIWLLVFLASFALMCAFGTSAHDKVNKGFLWGVISLQALLLTACLAGLVSFASAGSAGGVITRIVMLLVLAVLVLGLSMCASLARTGWLGG